jgi:hypothetical protein
MEGAYGGSFCFLKLFLPVIIDASLNITVSLPLVLEKYFLPCKVRILRSALYTSSFSVFLSLFNIKRLSIVYSGFDSNSLRVMLISGSGLTVKADTAFCISAVFIEREYAPFRAAASTASLVPGKSSSNERSSPHKNPEKNSICGKRK